MVLALALFFVGAGPSFGIPHPVGRQRCLDYQRRAREVCSFLQGVECFHFALEDQAAAGALPRWGGLAPGGLALVSERLHAIIPSTLPVVPAVIPGANFESVNDLISCFLMPLASCGALAQPIVDELNGQRADYQRALGSRGRIAPILDMPEAFRLLRSGARALLDSVANQVSASNRRLDQTQAHLREGSWVSRMRGLRSDDQATRNLCREMSNQVEEFFALIRGLSLAGSYVPGSLPLNRIVEAPARIAPTIPACSPQVHSILARVTAEQTRIAVSREIQQMPSNHDDQNAGELQGAEFVRDILGGMIVVALLPEWMVVRPMGYVLEPVVTPILDSVTGLRRLRSVPGGQPSGRIDLLELRARDFRARSRSPRSRNVQNWAAVGAAAVLFEQDAQADTRFGQVVAELPNGNFLGELQQGMRCELNRTAFCLDLQRFLPFARLQTCGR